ncbi:unnamed protein product [Aspergillus oryzae]|uniref:Unnamed protein product n=1 Tax=Aspergillus oryzae TaxID=5062 RepID=A0AAN4YDB6_ASPOZ|nr:unnamed protein product [Aspergillus oryzae]GMF91011.1 unnamed protein product [Aspergillus oryzae]GMG27610.1 unnamed protein product [Aspergillus oryzae]
MKAGAKRALAECLETDDLYSEVVNDAIWTENSVGLHIARDNGRLHVLGTKVETLQAELRETQPLCEVNNKGPPTSTTS